MTCIAALICLTVVTVGSLALTVFVFLRFSLLQERLVKMAMVEHAQKLAAHEAVEKRIAGRPEKKPPAPSSPEHWGAFPSSGIPG